MGSPKKLLVTGGAGFIGVNFVRLWVGSGGITVNLDLITYAGNPENLASLGKDPRRGHDRRYAIDTRKIGRELGWQPRVRFEGGLRPTVVWYLQHMDRVDHVHTGAYRDWIRRNYEQRVAQ